MTSIGNGGESTGLIAMMIARDFGSFDNFRNEMETVSMRAFGPGWSWLGHNHHKKKLEVIDTSGEGYPLLEKNHTNFCDRSVGACIIPRLPRATK